ncbi:multidrug effflux MFS transporter [Nonomuraea longispora]|nr:multidrug effflux MFS transporter [Nonomuraea longispora]
MPQNPVPSPERTKRLLLALAGLTAVAPLATDMYVPGLPVLAASLSASESSVQVSLTAFLVGLAVGQLLLGPVSDALGRRRVLLTGAALFTAFSVACALAPNIHVLNAARLLQGIAGAAGMVVARAVLTDRYHGTAEAARHFAALSVIVFVAPVVAPALGGTILEVASWQVIFVALAGFGVLLIVGTLAWVPESLPVSARRRGGVPGTLRAIGALLRERALVGYLLASSLASAALFAYIAGSPFVFQGLYGLSATQYSLVFAGNALGMFAAGLAFGRLSARMRVHVLLGTGLALALAATSALAVVLFVTGGSFGVTWAGLFLVVVGLGVTLPATVTIIQSLGHRAPGAASGLIGGGQFLLGAAASPLTGLMGTGSPLPMTVFMLTAFALAALAVIALGRNTSGPKQSKTPSEPVTFSSQNASDTSTSR